MTKDGGDQIRQPGAAKTSVAYGSETSSPPVEYFNLEVRLLSMLLPMLAEVRFNRRYRIGLKHLAPDARLRR
jgi:hypothetical protein